MPNSVFTALLGTGFTFLMTIAGSSVVFFFSKEIPDKLHKAFLGFAAGVMVAASIWSLLIPSIEQAQTLGFPGWFPASMGFLAGALFLFLFKPIQKIPLLLLSITLHNIPEGMAVGLAWPLALGIGIQNFPEGAAVSLPLRKKGLSKTKAFLLGSATGIVEPIFGCLAILLAQHATILMPWLLAFAAGAMIYVVVEELIPEAHFGESSSIGTISTLFGFLLMMILDVSFS
jgi:ZIP family zinc transporter